MSKKILILQAISQCIEISNDVKKRGFTPAYLVQNLPEALVATRDHHVNNLPKDSEIIYEQDTYEETLKLVKKVKPVFILYVSEASVELASRLSSDLGLPGNDYKYVDFYTKKDAMQTALKEYGIRYIKGEVAHDVKEAIDIYHKFGDRPVVLKALRGAAAANLKFCNSEEDIKEYADTFFSSTNSFTGNKENEVLVQEFVSGDEYVVNTMTVNGKSIVVGLWKYELTFIEGHPIFSGFQSYTPEEFNFIGLSELIQYAYDANKALKITNGPAHCEFFVDDRGPVLIEANCRMMGGPLFESFLKPVFGNSETAFFTDSLFFKNFVNYREEGSLNFYYKGITKLLYSPNKNVVVSLPIKEITKKLKTFHKLLVDDNLVGKEIPKTIDVNTVIGSCYFMGSEPSEVTQDYDVLRMIEEKYYHMLFECEDEPEGVEYKPKGMTIDEYWYEYIIYGSVLYINDTNEQIKYGRSTKLENVFDELDNYDFGLLNLSKKPNMNREQLVKYLFEFFNKVKISGCVFIPNSCISVFPYGNKAYELLLKLSGFEILIPKDSRRGIFAKRRHF